MRVRVHQILVGCGLIVLIAPVLYFLHMRTESPKEPPGESTAPPREDVLTAYTKINSKTVSAGNWTVRGVVKAYFLTLEPEESLFIHVWPEDANTPLPASCWVAYELFGAPDNALIDRRDTQLNLSPTLMEGGRKVCVGFLNHPFRAYGQKPLTERRKIYQGQYRVDIEIRLEDGTYARLDGLTFKVVFGPLY